MSTFNFDEIIDRTNTNSLKYDFAAERGKPADVLPLWVADMDLKAPAKVLEALEKAVQHGIFGYSDTKQSYFDALQNWFASRFDWNIQSDWLVKTPGVVYAIAMAIRSLTNEGDSVIIQQPVYYPFHQMVVKNNRKLINSPLVYKGGSYQIDFHDFETKIVENNVKMFILCSPHNPVGRVWTKDELITLGDICLKHNVVVVSDEIHADFVYEGNRHMIFANVKPEYLQNTITCTAPSKTFNLAGLQVSNIFIANPDIRKKFQAEMNKSGYSELNTLGLIACQAAYEHGGEWLDELKKYLAGNLAFIRDFVKQRLPKIHLVEPQGTYLVWLDFTELGLTEEQREHLIVNKAKLWLDSGVMFGKDGEGFERVNIACPCATLQKAFEQLERAVKDLKD